MDPGQITSAASKKAMKSLLHITSVKLSRLLRHDAKKAKLTILKGGYVPLIEVLSHKCMSNVDMDFILKIVAADKKGRFDVIENSDGSLLIRANQGHSIDVRLMNYSSTKLLTIITYFRRPNESNQ
ncbi:hypothetical protein GJ496_011288 [Pomphorhynchus laevis]|nr:hypothetical protein GJ496_011288 [Pomphorhynchus laevis]